MKGLELYRWIALTALIIGGFNLGIQGLTGSDLILGIFGQVLGRLLFICIGVAAGYKSYLIYMEKFQKKLK